MTKEEFAENIIKIKLGLPKRMNINEIADYFIVKFSTDRCGFCSQQYGLEAICEPFKSCLLCRQKALTEAGLIKGEA